MTDETLAALAKALAHPARLQILRLLATQQECRGAELFGTLPLAQSTISQHLAVLKDAGLVESHPVGQASVYCLTTGVIEEFTTEVTALIAGAPTCSSKTGECR